MKEEVCYVAEDFKKELIRNEQSPANNMKYTLPDKSKIEIPGTLRIACPELLFDPV